MTIQENTSKINEEWKDINGYEGIYQVSNLGEVRGLNRKDSLGRDVRSKILKSSYDRDGYQVISLRKDNKKSTLKIHRLVADAFIPNPHAYPQVNHKDENKENNYVSNLEWCNNLYNSNWGTRNSRIVSKISHGVYAIDKKGSYQFYKSETEASLSLCIPVSAINDIVNKKNNRKSYMGHTFISEPDFNKDRVLSSISFERGKKISVLEKDTGVSRIFYSFREADSYYNKWTGYFGKTYRTNNGSNKIFKIEVY